MPAASDRAGRGPAPRTWSLNRGADPLVRTGRPRPVLLSRNQGSRANREAGQGAGCGRGRPSHLSVHRKQDTTARNAVVAGGPKDTPTPRGASDYLFSTGGVAGLPGRGRRCLGSPCFVPGRGVGKGRF